MPDSSAEAAEFIEGLRDQRLFGLPARTGRWLLIPPGIVVMLCLGAVYAWSVFRKPLEMQFDLNARQSLMPFTLMLLTFAIFMGIAGSMMERFGARTMIAVGGLTMGAGYVLAGLSGTHEGITLAYGLIAGAGIGIAYGAPLAIIAAWFPDRRGLALGLTISGFGLSPMFLAPLTDALIGTHGVSKTFLILGALLASVVLLLTPLLVSPARKSAVVASVRAQASNSTVYTGLISARFVALWMCYTLGTFAGLGAIGISAPVAQEIVRLDAKYAALSVSLFAIFNGLGRPVFGWIVDRTSPATAATINFVIVILACVAMLGAREGTVFIYLAAFGGFWFSLGGWLSIAPTATQWFFGRRNYARNYGAVFTAYGAGGVLGTIASGHVRDVLGSYLPAFYLMSALAVVGIAIALSGLRVPRR